MVSIDHAERCRCNRRSVPTRRPSVPDVRRCSTTIPRRTYSVSTFENANRGDSIAKSHLSVEKRRWGITSVLRTSLDPPPASVDRLRWPVWFSLSRSAEIDFGPERSTRAATTGNTEPSLGKCQEDEGWSSPRREKKVSFAAGFHLPSFDVLFGVS